MGLFSFSDRPVAMANFAKALYLSKGQAGHIICCLSSWPPTTYVIWDQRPLEGTTIFLPQENASTIQSISGKAFPTTTLSHAGQLKTV